MRSKEDALDYRYFPEPDLPPLEIPGETMQRLANETVEIPYITIKKFKEEYEFNKEYINALIADKEILDYFTSVTKREKGDPKTIAKWIAGPIAAWLKEHFKTIKELPFTKDNFIEFLKASEAGSLIENQLKIIMDEMLSTGKNPDEIIKEK